MLKNISFLALAGALTLSATACIVVTDDTADDETSSSGDGDGDPTGDGDGDPTGDGDGDPTTGDGDGDPTGDGDGDPTTGDGDGDPAPMCGWDPRNMYYDCGFEGEDPNGTFPSACPDGLVEGDPCATTGLMGEGCCDANGGNWYCAEGEVVAYVSCAG